MHLTRFSRAPAFLAIVAVIAGATGAHAQLGTSDALRNDEAGLGERSRTAPGVNTGPSSNVGSALHPIPRMNLPSAASIDAKARSVDSRWGGTGPDRSVSPPGSWKPEVSVFNEFQARAIITANGYSRIVGLVPAPDGSWQGSAHHKSLPRTMTMRVTLSRGGVVSAR